MEQFNVKGNTWCIDTGMMFIPFYKIDDKNIILIDTGWMRGDRKNLDALFLEQGYQVKAILVTHAHIDHVGNAAYFRDKFQCPVAMPREEADIVKSDMSLRIFFSDSDFKRAKEHYGHMRTPTDQVIEDQDHAVTLAGVPFDILHLPGHSPGHVAVVTPDDVCYLADALISLDVLSTSKMPYAFILSKDLESKVKLYHLRHSFYILAHKGVYHDIRDLITDNIYYYKNKCEEILQLVQHPMSFEDILRSTSRHMDIRIDSVDKYMVVKRMLRSYVDYLRETEKLKMVIEDDTKKYVRTHKGTTIPEDGGNHEKSI